MLALWKDAATGVRVVRLTKTTEGEKLVRHFARIAEEEGWQPGEALQQWFPRSVYFALEVQGKTVGGLQLVLPDTAGSLPCHTVWPEMAISSSHCVHIAILALEKGVRGQMLLFWRLVVEVWRYCVGEGITTLYLEVTPRVLPLYRRLGWPLTIEGELRLHWGEDCYLCKLGIPEVAETLLRKAEHSDYYRQIVAQALRVTLPLRQEKSQLASAVL